MSEIIQDFKQDYGRKKKIKEIYHLSEEPFYVDSGAGGVVYGAYMKKADEKVTTIEKKAIKIVPGIAIKVLKDITENELEQKYKEIETTIEENDIQVKREISNWQMASNCEHILPLDDNVQIIKWKYNEYIGIDYALPMPFASCLTKIIDKYKKDDCTLNETEDKIIQIGIDLCKALEELENLLTPICHRDIKPANIYYLNGKYCLGDFGISIETGKTQRTGTGTEAYRSPEQAKHVPQSERDHRQDIYSLGLVLYELADKHRIGDYTSDLSMRRKLPHLTNQYSRGLDQIIHRATQYYVNARFQHASEFRESLEKLQADPTFKLYDEEERYRTKDPEYIDSPYAEIEIVFSPETLWNAGAFWYEKSKEEGNRFLKRNIDEKIMPLATEKNQDSYRFPVNVYKEEDIEHSKIELSQIISKIEEIDDMYLIGEGGIGKTTALYSVMENTYKKDALYSEDKEKVVIPIFIELSKAPIQYVKAYNSFSSTFIRRYIYCLTEMRREKLGTTEQEKLLHDVMERDEISELEQIDSLLMKENSKAHYLLLLDGLNEVSRKQFEPDAQGNSGSAAEMISYEIQKLQTYKNVTVVITSRADETFYFGENITKYHLMGLEEDTIKEYLEKHNISAENIESNKRLKETLKVPLFLKLYSKLSSVEKISTPGEILYAFFNERTHEYSVRLRLREIEAEQQQFKAPYMVNFITEKMQLFIMDFLIPEIGWYMEKNELYTIDKDTIKCIIEPVLKGEQDIDICGKYGRAFFKEYHNGEDGSVNTQTYAEQLLKLNSHGDYVDDIIDHCVYSLGIFYVNNQEYGFIHQHIRDYFAALNIIIHIKWAIYILKQDYSSSIECLNEINENILDMTICQYIGEISEAITESKEDNILKRALSIYKNIYSNEASVGVRNLIQSIYNLNKTLSNMDFSGLDLRNYYFYGIDISGSIFIKSFINKKNLLPKINDVPFIRDGVFSPNGKYIILWSSEKFKIINRISLVDEFVSPDCIDSPYSLEEIEYSSSGKFFWVLKESVSLVTEFFYIVEIWDAEKYRLIDKKILFKPAHSGIEHYSKKEIKISPDDKYLMVASSFDKIILYPIFPEKRKKKFYLRERKSCSRKRIKDILDLSYIFYLNRESLFRLIRTSYLIRKEKMKYNIERLFWGLTDFPYIATGSYKKYIAFASAFSENIFFYDAKSLKYEIQISIKQQISGFITDLLFSPDEKYLAVFTYEKIYILDIEKKLIFRECLGTINDREVDIDESKFLMYDSQLCLLLKLKKDYDNYEYVLWALMQDEIILKLSKKDYGKIYDCLGNSLLFSTLEKDRNLVVRIKKFHSDSDIKLSIGELEDMKKNVARIKNAFYTNDHKYLVVYSNKCIQIMDASTFYVLHELMFQEEISVVGYSDFELYAGCKNGHIKIIEMETFDIRYDFDSTVSNIENITLSPLETYLVIEFEVNENINAFALYDKNSFAHIFTFYGDYLQFSHSEKKIVIGCRWSSESNMIEEWSIVKKDIDSCYSVKKNNAVKWESVLKNLYKEIRVDKMIYISEINKIMIYFFDFEKTNHKLLIWNLDDKRCEEIITAQSPVNTFEKSNNSYCIEEKEKNDNYIFKRRNLNTLKYERVRIHIKKPHYSTIKTKVYENEILIPRIKDIEILDLKTKKYNTILFLPGFNIHKAKFKKLHTLSDIDEEFLQDFERYGAIIK